MDTQIATEDRIARLRKMLSVDSSNVRLRGECIDAALQVRDYDGALTLSEEGLSLAPTNELLLFAKSNALIGAGRYGDATELLALLHAQLPENTGISQNLALCHYCLGGFAAARNLLEEIYAGGERATGVVRLLVSSCHHLGLMERATAVADENKELVRADSALAGVCALAYLDESRSRDAARCAVSALRSNPRCIDALVVDATLKMATGDVDRAKAEFESVLAMNSKVGRAWIGLASIALLMRDIPEAKAALGRGLEYMPEHVGSWHLLGWTHLVVGETAAAERAFEQAMELNRNFAETHGALASLAALRGELNRAREMLKIANRLDPACLSARLAESLIAARLGNPERSQQLVSEALDNLAGGDRQAFALLLNIATRKGKPN